MLEHIPDYQAVLVEIERILKPGGLFCASVPRAWPEKICWALSDEYHEVEGGHLRIFKASELRKQIQGLGFRFYRRALGTCFAFALLVVEMRLLGAGQQSTGEELSQLLVWDLLDRPLLTRTIEQGLNPVMGKSVVMYFQKGQAV